MWLQTVSVANSIPLGALAALVAELLGEANLWWASLRIPVAVASWLFQVWDANRLYDKEDVKP